MMGTARIPGCKLSHSMLLYVCVEKLSPYNPHDPHIIQYVQLQILAAWYNHCVELWPGKHHACMHNQPKWADLLAAHGYVCFCYVKSHACMSCTVCGSSASIHNRMLSTHELTCLKSPPSTKLFCSCYIAFGCCALSCLVH